MSSVAVPPAGAVGTVAGMTGAEAADGEPAPAASVAVTVNVYEVPLVRPDTVHEVVAEVQVFAPGEEVTL